MKKIICLVLTLGMLLSLCACGGGGTDSDVQLNSSAKDLIAAVQQNSGARTADKLVGMEDADFAVILSMLLGIDTEILTDGAMAISTTTAANEILVLCVENSADVETVKQAYETHKNDSIMSDERYFPENVELYKQALVFTNENFANGHYVIMVIDENMGMIKSAFDQLLGNPDLIPQLAETFYTTEPPKPEYDYTQPVPGSETVEYSWFNDAMFIGDSRMKGMMNCAAAEGWFTPGLDLTKVGLTVNNIYSEYVPVNGISMSVADGIRSEGNYTKCYILLGINELGWSSSERFIECYKELVELVKESHPEAQIYIIGNLPLGDSAIYSGSWLTNENVIRFNDYIMSVAADEEVYYIDAFNLLQVDGKLPAESANDGIHVQPGVCRTLVEYLMSHTVEE